MIIYKCRVTGDEMISDAYKLREVTDPESGEVVPELVECDSLKVNKDGGDVDVGCGDAFGGAGADEAVDDAAELVNNIIDADLGFGYNEVPMGKKDFKDFLKTYCGQVRQMLKDDDKIPGPEVKVRRRVDGRGQSYPNCWVTGWVTGWVGFLQESMCL